ncbi:MAG: hypothetical protein LBL86_01770 [Coriobacteriales bacterium]|jgi:hypothetical protein|nr:hypothetical protein [Coriobacteriales bacterium]
MMRTAARTMDFFDRQVSVLIKQRHEVDEHEAVRMFLSSKTYRMLTDDEMKLWHLSPLALYDIWESEHLTGSPLDSLYLRV